MMLTPEEGPLRVIRCVALLTLFAVSLGPRAAAQADAQSDTTRLSDSTTEDVIHLKSGETLRGRILDSETTKQSLLIRMRDGKDVRISKDKVARVVRGQRPATPGAAPQIPSQAPSAAQQGFWIGLGMGWGSSGLSCELCPDDRFEGFAGYVNGGGTVSPSIRLGGELTRWVNSEEGAEEHMMFVSFVGVFSVDEKFRLFLKGGVGYMWYAGNAGADEVTATAPAFLLGGGYEFLIGRHLGIVPFVNSLTTLDASLKLNGQSADNDANIRFNLIQLGLALSWNQPR